MTRSAHQPSNQPGLSEWGVVDDVEAEGRAREIRRDRGRRRGGCPSFKHAGLNGTDSSDI